VVEVIARFGGDPLSQASRHATIAVFIDMLHAASRNSASGAVQPGSIDECLLCPPGVISQSDAVWKRVGPNRECQTAGHVTMCQTASASHAEREDREQSSFGPSLEEAHRKVIELCGVRPCSAPAEISRVGQGQIVP
jgi:hypothetical protein